MTTENDFGFTTLSADDYAAQQKPVAPVVVDLDAVSTQISHMNQFLQIMDEKLEQIRGTVTTVDETPDQIPKERLVKMANLIMPLLKNLRDTAHDEIIKWPNRGPLMQSKIDQIEALLNL